MSSIIKVNTVQDTDGNNIINENANTITIGASGDTISIPSGATLANNGTATGFAAIDWQSTIVTGATHTASANQGLWIDTTSNACNLTLPASPSAGDQLIFADVKRKWGTNAVTLTLNGSKYQGNTSPAPVYDTSGETVHIVYSGDTTGWVPINDGAVAMETPQTYTIEHLVVAGGGSGALSKSGGGGAGGMVTNFGGTPLTINGGTVYTITVGGGGSFSSNPGADGTASSIAGSDITNVTTVGGGGGGSDNGANKFGRDGGSGGGGGFPGTTGGSGTAGQGNNGGNGFPDGTAGGGGGGGKGGTGANATSSSGGAGGVGESNSITGAAVFYAGGGGGTTETSGTQGAGGNGGGGTASKDGTASSGTANTGGGGGATNSGTVGNGGSGVVILRIPTADFSNVTTGSPTVATDGSHKVVTFTGDGSYTG